MGYKIAPGTTLTIQKTHFVEHSTPTEVPIDLFVFWFDPSINRHRQAKLEGGLITNKKTKGWKLSGKQWPPLVPAEFDTPGALDHLLEKFNERHTWCLDSEAYLSKIGALPPKVDC